MAYIVISSQGEEIATQNLRCSIRIGRSPECDISVHDHLMSRRHCRLQTARGGWTAVDLDSRNGTFINGRRAARQVLADGDELLVGTTTILFREGVAPALRPGGKPKMARPADPFEALAGTVFAFELEESKRPKLQVLAGRPVPMPAPLAPVGYEQEGVGTLVLEMLSDVHDTRVKQRPVRRSVSPSTVSARPADPRSPIVQARSGRAVARPVALAASVMRAVKPMPAAASRQATRVVASPARMAQRTFRGAVRVPARRHKRSGMALDLSMGALMMVLLGIVVVATRALFLMSGA